MALLWDLVFTIPMPPFFGVGFPRCRGGLCHGSGFTAAFAGSAHGCSAGSRARLLALAMKSPASSIGGGYIPIS